MFFRHHCKFQSRNIKFQSPVIKLQDGVFNVKVIDMFCFKFLEKSCMKKKLTISTVLPRKYNNHYLQF